MLAEISASTASQTYQGGDSRANTAAAQLWWASRLSSAAMIRPESAILFTLCFQRGPDLGIAAALRVIFPKQVQAGKTPFPLGRRSRQIGIE